MPPNNTVTVLCPPCMVCGVSDSVIVPSAGFFNWKNGAFVQDAFPELSADDREMLMTGTHNLCWEKMAEAE